MEAKKKKHMKKKQKGILHSSSGKQIGFQESKKRKKYIPERNSKLGKEGMNLSESRIAVGTSDASTDWLINVYVLGGFPVQETRSNRDLLGDRSPISAAVPETCMLQQYGPRHIPAVCKSEKGY